jgi:hypothetical protein
MRFFAGTDNPDFVRNPEGKRSSDEYKLLVQPFMDRYFCYAEKFVCITVRADDDSHNLADTYGFQFELKPTIINEIAIVCAGDFQNVIYEAYRALLQGKDIKEYVECFDMIPADADPSKRMEILANSMSKAKNAERPYVEARVYRCLRRSDCIDPDSGEHESIALLLQDEDENAG